MATGVNDAHDLARAPKNQRPTYIAAGLGALAEKQPGVTVEGARHTCEGWTAEVVNNAVSVKGEGEPYDGLRAILSAVWAAVDAPAKPAAKTAKTRRPHPPPAPQARPGPRLDRHRRRPPPRRPRQVARLPPHLEGCPLRI